MDPFYAKDNTNNYIYYCYNAGTVSSTKTDYLGAICGTATYFDTDYVYSLEGTIIKEGTVANKNFGVSSNYLNANNQDVLNKSALINKMISFQRVVNEEFFRDFKEDYTGENSINGGFPILSWQ